MMRYFRNEKGFTLIELMVVILIIGILVAIAIPVFNSARANANKKSCLANLRTMVGAAETYKAANDEYPTDYADYASKIVPSYIKSMPKCPTDSATYTITGGTASTAPTISCPNASLGHAL